VVEALLRGGADPFLADTAGTTPVGAAVQAHRPAVAALLGEAERVFALCKVRCLVDAGVAAAAAAASVVGAAAGATKAPPAYLRGRLDRGEALPRVEYPRPAVAGPGPAGAPAEVVSWVWEELKAALFTELVALLGHEGGSALVSGGAVGGLAPGGGEPVRREVTPRVGRVVSTCTRSHSSSSSALPAPGRLAPPARASVSGEGALAAPRPLLPRPPQAQAAAEAATVASSAASSSSSRSS
jgi:hypothetical protein